jgi:hypothetical protein
MNWLRNLYPEAVHPGAWEKALIPPSPDWWFAISKNRGRPWYYVLKSPVIAHSFNFWLSFSIFRWVLPFLSWLLSQVTGWPQLAPMTVTHAAIAGVAVVFAGQLQAWDKLGPGGYNARNVIWRTMIAVLWAVLVVLVT